MLSYISISNFKLLGLGLAIATSIATTPVVAQNFAEFNCTELLLSDQLKEPLQRYEGENFPYLYSVDGSDPIDVDPVNLRETLGSNNQPLMMEDVVPVSGDTTEFRFMTCSLIVVEFIDKATLRSLDLSDESGRFKGQRLPILLVNLTQTEDEYLTDLNHWSERNYDISAIFDGFAIGRRQIQPNDFSGIALFRDYSWDDQRIRLTSVEDAPMDVRQFLIDSDVLADDILVICGVGPCSETPIIRTVMDALSGPEQTLARTEDIASEVEVEVDPVEEIASTVDVDAVNTAVEVSIDTAIVDDENVAAKLYERSFTYLSTQGVETSAPLETIARLECLLYAVSQDLFIVPPENCRSTAFDQLRAQNPLLQIGIDRQIQIVAGARFPTAETLNVELPDGVLGTTCLLSARYMSTGGVSRLVEMSPVPQADPARFTAELTSPPALTDNKVTFEIELGSTASECGGDGRSIEVATAREVTVDLVAEDRRSGAVLHVLLNQQSTMEDILGQGDVNAATQFVMTSVNGIRGAHSRTTNVNADEIWNLTFGAVLWLGDRNNMNPMVTMDSEILRTSPSTAFSGVSPDLFREVAQSNPRLTAGELEAAMRPLVIQARDERGLDSLTITLIGAVAPRNVNGLENPCSDGRFSSLSTDLSDIGGIDVNFVVFPLVKLFEDDLIEMTSLAPLDQDPLAPSLPSGLYACQSHSARTDVYPFFFEPSRDPVEFGSRFATSLSSQIAAVLEAINSQRDH